MAMDKSEQIDAIAAAFAKAQGKVKHAVKDSTNPHFKSKYSDLASIWEACRDALTENGIGVIQAPFSAEHGEIGLETMLLHASGQFMSRSFTMPVPQFTPQGVGSALTYARRYALAAMVGVSPDDDDGEGAMARGHGGTVPASLRERVTTAAATLPDPEGKAILESADSIELLQDLWSSLTPAQRHSCAKIKEQMKAKLQGAQA